MTTHDEVGGVLISPFVTFPNTRQGSIICVGLCSGDPKTQKENFCLSIRPSIHSITRVEFGLKFLAFSSAVVVIFGTQTQRMVRQRSSAFLEKFFNFSVILFTFFGLLFLAICKF